MLIGTATARAELRARLPSSIEVVGETATLSEARLRDFDADGWLMAPPADIDEGAADVAVEPLTPRETDVLLLLADGLSNKAIATRLGLSDQTVKFHVASICGKLGAGNRTEAVRRAIRRGLVPL
ncbi:MAG TPA: response regulator transcription factor [Vicinamibacterales bacterium]|nr:response regulator transcription factor [Vicinamibacterales bacterium]